jgi:hypothetical protein
MAKKLWARRMPSALKQTAWMPKGGRGIEGHNPAIHLLAEADQAVFEDVPLPGLGQPFWMDLESFPELPPMGRPWWWDKPMKVR